MGAQPYDVAERPDQPVRRNGHVTGGVSVANSITRHESPLTWDELSPGQKEYWYRKWAGDFIALHFGRGARGKARWSDRELYWLITGNLELVEEFEDYCRARHDGAAT